LQYGGRTSETIKLVAELMDKVPGLKKLASPAKIENLILGWSGGFGRLALDTGDWLIKQFGIVDTPPDPAMTLADIPGIKGFITRFPTASTASIEEFYDEYSQLKMKWESGKERAGVRGKGIEGIPRPELLVKYEAAAKTLSMGRKIAEGIYESRNLTPELKKEYLDNVYYGMINVARTALNRSEIKRPKPIPLKENK